MAAGSVWSVRVKSASAAVLAAALVALSPVAASDAGLRRAADIGAYGLPVVAAGIALGKDDRRGLLELGESYGASFVATQGLKYAINSSRPNGGNHSFPSGHTSSAFAAAGYLHARYGWQYGVPAEIVATLVGVSRVITHDHHWYDVVAGAAIGEGAAFVLTDRLNDRVRLVPYADAHGGGLELSAHF